MLDLVNWMMSRLGLMLHVDFTYHFSTYVDKDQYVDQYLPSVVG